MTYAQIRSGIVINIIVLDDPALAAVFSKGFDCCLRIDNLDPVPQIGWAYDPVAGFSSGGM